MIMLDTIAPNLTRVTVGRTTVWFSYSTAIAVQEGDYAPTVAQNEWSATTGKHLTMVDGGGKEAKGKRVPWATLVDTLAALFPAGL